MTNRVRKGHWKNKAKLGMDRVSGQMSMPHEGSFAGKWNAQNEPNFGSVGRTRWLFLLYSSSGGGYTWGFCVHFYVHGLELIDYEK
jgi:hypothetical protein